MQFSKNLTFVTIAPSEMFLKFIAILTVLSQLPLIFCEDESPITFYDLKTKQTLSPPITTMVADSQNLTLDSINVVNFVRLPFIGQPCETFRKFHKV